MPLYPTGASRIPLRKTVPNRSSLGPPDVYPQDPNQKEDELNAVHVKQGFNQNHASLVNEEYGTLVSKTDGSAPVTSSKVLADLKSIMTKKEDANTLPDSGRRKQSINTRDNFWLVTGRNKPAVDNWLRELAGNRRPFSSLLRKVPIFNKKEEVLTNICEFEVPTSRAIWYIKMCAAYAMAMQELNKTKKRQVSDPSQEWTHTLTRFLKDQLSEIVQNDEGRVGNSLPFKQWTYSLELCDQMYNQGLLDRQEFLQWILEMVEKCRYADEPTMRLVLPVVLTYAKEFCQSELLCRKLAYQCARKVTYLVSESDAIYNASSANNQSENSQMHPVVSAFLELTNDPYTRFIILGLSSVLQMITLECPSAMVWHYFGENKTPSSLLGSPLDHLPNCAPSGLPMPVRQSNPAIRHRIRMSENLIKERSKQVEEKWSVDPNQTLGKMGPRVDKNLSVLEVLDNFNFDRLDSNVDCLEVLYTKLFGSSSSSSVSALDADDDVIVHTLCEWAVTSMRSGEHRAFVVAKLLERRQSEWTFQQSGGQADDNENDDKNSESDMYMNMNVGPPLFQSRLFDYLDSSAPKMDNLQEFSNLVLLFHELICHDVFSHDSYLCSLISRGDVMGPISDSSKDHDKSNNSDEAENSFDESKIDGDLTNLLNQIKEGNQLNDPFSPTNDREKDKNESMSGLPDVSKKGRHWQYVYHFPLPQDESSTHDCNQRNVLLYGVGRGRDDASRSVKKIHKDITKLFSKKFSIDVSDGGKVKKHNKGDVIFEQVVQRFQNLSYYDQHCVSQQCGQTMIEMLSAFANSNANYLPLPEYVSFLFDLTSLALNIQGILEWCLQILKELPGVESQLIERGSCLTRTYTTTLSLYIVGVLRRYHTIFLLNSSDVVTAFEHLNRVAYRPKLQSMDTGSSLSMDCNSSEWCILAYMYDLSGNCTSLQARERYSDLKRLFSGRIAPSESSCLLTDKKFGLEYIANPKKKVDPLTIKLLIENPQNQYNLVCNVLMEVCGCNDNEKLNDIAILCCEFTAQCPSLSSEWLGALAALCNAGASDAYQDLLQFISVSDQSIYNRLGVFSSILIARHCFQLQDFVTHVAITSMIKTYGDVKEGNSNREAEVGARLTCHLLLMLFQTVDGMFPNNQNRTNSYGSGIRYSCDRQFLAYAHRNITVPPLIAALKVMLLLGDAEDSTRGMTKIFNVDDDDDDDFGLSMKSSSKGRQSNEKLSDFAKHTLKQICSQEWVHNRCLQNTDDLLKKSVLLDTMLSSKQAQKLLRMICMQHKTCPDLDVADDATSQRRILTKILENLDEWNLRISTIDIKLMYHQLSQTGNGDSGAWLDAAAGAIVDIFRLNDSDEHMEVDDDTNRQGNKNTKRKFSSVWIIPYLVRNLKFLQSRVLKVSSNILECGNLSKSSSGPKPGNSSRPNSSAYSRKDNSKSGGNSKESQVPPGHQPFLQLVLTCLRELDNGADKKQDREEQKENLLQSLHTQLSTFLIFTKDDKHEDPYARKTMQDALQLRFSLVGGVFDTICRNFTSITDWSVLLVQLIVRGVVDLTNNSDLFTTVLDMLNILIHSTLIQDREQGNSERSEESRKHYNYHTLVKKLKKEIGEKSNVSVKYLRQLLPIPKMMSSVIVTEPFGLVTEKGNKVKGLNSDKKPGMQVSEKQKLSPWDILEGHKTPAPLSWAWFGASKHERKNMRYEEGFHELKYASLAMEKPKSYYSDPPPLPPEDLEPASSQNKDTAKADPMRGAQPNMMGMQGGPSGMMNQPGMPYYNNPQMMGPGGYRGGPMGPGMNNQQPMGAGGPGNFNPQGQRMPYMNQYGNNAGGPGWNAGQGGGGGGMPMGPGGPRGPFMGMGNNMGPGGMNNMGNPMYNQQMMPRGARPMGPMGPGGQGLPTGARPMMSNQMYAGQPNQSMMGGPNNQNWGGPTSTTAPGYGSPATGQYAQQPYHSPNMQPGSMGPQRFPGPQGNQGGPQQRSIGANPKQALQDMLRARHTDPQFSSGPGNNFVPPGRQSFQMRPSMNQQMNPRMPQTSMYGAGSGGNPQGQYGASGGSGGPNPNSGNYGNFQNQGQQYPYGMMNQNQQGQQRPPYQMPGSQMGMRPQNMQYPMGGQRNPNPGAAGNYMNMGGAQGNYRAQMNMNPQMNQSNQQNMMRMQNPQLIAQLQRGTNNMNPQQQQQQSMGGYGGQQGRF